jgi:hypothetical protein
VGRALGESGGDRQADQHSHRAAQGHEGEAGHATTSGRSSTVQDRGSISPVGGSCAGDECPREPVSQPRVARPRTPPASRRGLVGEPGGGLRLAHLRRGYVYGYIAGGIGRGNCLCVRIIGRRAAVAAVSRAPAIPQPALAVVRDAARTAPDCLISGIDCGQAERACWFARASHRHRNHDLPTPDGRVSTPS